MQESSNQALSNLQGFEGGLKLAPCSNILRIIEDSETQNATVSHRSTKEGEQEEDEMTLDLLSD